MKAKLVKEDLNEIYTKKDFERGDEFKDTASGFQIHFKADYKNRVYVVKQLVRLKYQIEQEFGDKFNNKFDEILDRLEGML